MAGHPRSLQLTSTAQGHAARVATSAGPREPVSPTGVAPTSSFRWGSSYAGPCRHTQEEWG